MSKYIIVLICVVLSSHTIAQQLTGFETDSIINELKQKIDGLSDSDTNKLNLIKDLHDILLIDYPQEAKNWSNKGLSVAKNIGTDLALADAFNMIARTEDKLGKHGVAIDYYFKALKRYESQGDNRRAAIMLHNTGYAYLLWRDLENAEKYANKFLNASIKIEDTMMIMRANNSLANIYLERENPQEARHYYLEAIRLSDIINDQIWGYRTRFNLALTWMDEDWNKCLTTVLEAINTVDKNKYPNDWVRANYNLAYLYNQKNMINESVETAQLGLELAKQHEYGALILDYHKLLESSYGKLNDFENAYKHLITIDSIEKLNSSEHQKDEIRRLEAKYDSEKKEKDLIISENARNILEKDKALKDRLIYGIVIGIILFLIAVYYRWKQSIRTKENEKLQLQVQVEKSNKELELLRTAIEVRVGEGIGILSDSSIDNNLNNLLTDPLSERELDVLRELCHGKSNKEIAENLHVSVNTIKTHLMKIYSKLEVNNRHEAIRKITILGK